MEPICPLWATADVVPRSEVLGGSRASIASCAEVSSTPLELVPPTSIPSGIGDATPCSDHPTSHTRCPSVEEVVADVCKALNDSHGSFRLSLSEVQALLGDDWGPPIHVTVPSYRCNNLSSRHANSGTSPPRAMSQTMTVLRMAVRGTGGGTSGRGVGLGWVGLFRLLCDRPCVVWVLRKRRIHQ